MRYKGLLVLIIITIGLELLGCGASRAIRYNRLGLEAAKYGLWREATVRFEQAVLLHPNDARLHNNLAVAYEAQSRNKEAEAEYTKSAQLAPGLKPAHDNFASFAGDATAPTHEVKPPDEQE